jgi:hypothetical protein
MRVTTAGPSIDESFQSFTDEWMRFHTDDAAEARYFTGAEQDAIERRDPGGRAAAGGRPLTMARCLHGR